MRVIEVLQGGGDGGWRKQKPDTDPVWLLQYSKRPEMRTQVGAMRYGTDQPGPGYPPGNKVY